MAARLDAPGGGDGGLGGLRRGARRRGAEAQEAPAHASGHLRRARARAAAAARAARAGARARARVRRPLCPDAHVSQDDPDSAEEVGPQLAEHRRVPRRALPARLGARPAGPGPEPEDLEGVKGHAPLRARGARARAPVELAGLLEAQDHVHPFHLQLERV